MVKKKPSRKSRKKVHTPVVMVSIPHNAKLIVKRKKHNPYFMDVTEQSQDGKTNTHHTWGSENTPYGVGQ